MGAGNSKPVPGVGNALAAQVPVEPAPDLLAQALGDPVGGLRVVATGVPDDLPPGAPFAAIPARVRVGLAEAEQRVLGALDEQGLARRCGPGPSAGLLRSSTAATSGVSVPVAAASW